MNKTWAQRVRELEATGLSLTNIGDAVDLSPQALSDIKQERTTEPKGMAAVRLYQLHEKRSKSRARKIA